MNLVGNAVKFTERGEVVVRADVESIEGDRATVRLTVADTGIGMDATAMGKIFEPFAQADETTTRRFGGTGLGLAICRELADLMGGRIAVESQPGVGSTFELSLPLEVRRRDRAPASRRSPRRTRAHPHASAVARGICRAPRVGTRSHGAAGRLRRSSKPISWSSTRPLVPARSRRCSVAKRNATPRSS